jgi:hypothetical protein
MKNKIRFWMKSSRLISGLWNWAWSHLFFRQWIVLATSELNESRPLWDNFSPIVPPPDRFWADPFVWVYEGIFFIFVEEFLYETGRGRIACLSLDKQLKPVSISVALERPYHLSYPFLFEHENQLYMLPETKGNFAIELYQCKSFPCEWVFIKTLKANVSAVDSTLLESNGKWWLFTCLTDRNNSGLDALYLYYADQPTSEQWISHPQNPIVKDLKFARPAGRIFLRNGDFIRPSQDCSLLYGRAINFSRITMLTESKYEEIHESTLRPPRMTNILATHTWNESKDLRVTDALLYWLRLQTGKSVVSPN